jgi:SNF family Na+-dependent transporter
MSATIIQAVMHSFFIGTMDGLFRFAAGFAVFVALGHMAHLENIEVFPKSKCSGFGLLFGTYPVLFGKLAGGMHWVRLCCFFFYMFTLGIDSGFGLSRRSIDGRRRYDLSVPVSQLVAVGSAAPARVFSESHLHDRHGLELFGCHGLFINRKSETKCDAAPSRTQRLLTIIHDFATDVMILVRFLESFAAGWIFGVDAQIEPFGPETIYSYMFANFGAIITASFCGSFC